MLSESPGWAFDVEDDGPMYQAIEDGGSDDGVAEYLAPVGQSPVGGDQGGVAFAVAFVNDVEVELPRFHRHLMIASE